MAARDMSLVRPKKISIKGIVIPSGWDAAGRITAVRISAADEVEYLVSAAGKGGELFGLIHQPVIVAGVLETDRHGMRVLRVDAYQLLRSGDEHGGGF